MNQDLEQEGINDIKAPNIGFRESSSPTRRTIMTPYGEVSKDENIKENPYNTMMYPWAGYPGYAHH